MPEEFDQELIPYLTALGLSTIDPSASELRRASTMRAMRKSALERKERISYDLPPDVHDLIAAFIDCFGREYTSGEKSYWIKIARSWLELGVTPDQVKKMYSHCAEKGMTIKSPDSLTWAWDDLRLSGEQVSKQKFANTY